MPNYEIDQLEKLSTWVIVDLPNGAPVIPCTEVLKKSEVQMVRLKAIALE